MIAETSVVFNRVVLLGYVKLIKQGDHQTEMVVLLCDYISKLKPKPVNALRLENQNTKDNQSQPTGL